MSKERTRDRVSAGRKVAFVVLVALVVLAMTLAACGDGGAPASGSGGAAKTDDTIVGAGASFPFPLYSKWGQEYNAESGVKLNYQSIGSGGGISAIEQNTVDFGASDAPLDAAELEAEGLVQFPMCVGGIVMVVNLDGVESGALKLDADTLASIYMGTITSWDDAAIKSLNPGLDLPATDITVAHRSDGSGTTWIFTNYLTAAAGDVWTAGADKEIDWPTGVGGKGNEGVAASVQQVKGSIGYVEYAYAKQNSMTWTQLQNADGTFVDPSLESFGQAAAEADWTGTPGFGVVLVDQPGPDTWPITGASFILMRKEQDDATRGKMTLDFFDWAYASGATSAEALDYVPIPDKVSELVRSDAWSQITADGAPVWKP
jgi:phosphate transport system substrate-binding protein